MINPYLSILKDHISNHRFLIENYKEVVSSYTKQSRTNFSFFHAELDVVSSLIHCLTYKNISEPLVTWETRRHLYEKNLSLDLSSCHKFISSYPEITLYDLMEVRTFLTPFYQISVIRSAMPEYNQRLDFEFLSPKKCIDFLNQGTTHVIECLYPDKSFRGFFFDVPVRFAKKTMNSEILYLVDDSVVLELMNKQILHFAVSFLKIKEELSIEAKKAILKYKLEALED